MTKFVALRPKTYSYWVDDESVTKKVKGTKNMVTKRGLKFNNYKNCLLNNETVLPPQKRFKSEGHDLYTEEVNKIELRSNIDKIILDYDGITAYPYETSAGKVYKLELLRKLLKYKMINFHDYTNENKTQHNPK